MSFYDSTVRHAVYIERYKKQVARKVLDRIDALTGSLFNEVAQSDLEAMTRRDLDRLLARLNRVVAGAYAPVVEEIDTALREFAVYEGEWQATNLVRAGVVADIAVPSDADIWAAMYSRPFQGKILKGWLDGLAPNTADRVQRTIRQGYIDGRSSLDIAREIRGTRGRPGVMDISRRGAETMVRTAVAHTASRAGELTYRKSGRIKSVQWASVLDHRTSSICRNNDGRVGPVRKGGDWEAPAGFKVLKPLMARPPAHPSCRSTVLPMTANNTAALRVRPTYNDWLSKQPSSVQDDILGKSKGKLYREGGYTVDRFSDQSGQEYTLDQLRAKDRDTFNDLFGGASSNRGPSKPSKVFTYGTVNLPKNTDELNTFIKDNGIASSGRIKGAASRYAEPMRAALEVVERFDAPKLDGVGPLSQYGYKGRVGAAAAIATFKYSDGTKKIYLYLPSNFGDTKNAAKQFRANTASREGYTKEAKVALDRLGTNADPRAVALFNSKVRRDGINFTRASSVDGSAYHAAIIHHEYGHVLMDVDKKMGPEIAKFLKDEKPMASGWQHILSKYGGQNESEFVAESFSHYMAGTDEHWRIHPRLLDIFTNGDALK